MGCTHTRNCELFAQFAFNPALKVWQIHYCDADYKRCARYTLSLQGKRVPLNLLPNGQTVQTPRSSMAHGAAALFNAILKGRVSMVTSLLRTGVDVQVQNADGTTPLIAAASIGNAQIVELLLAKGADTNARNAAGQSAMDVAAANGFAAIAELLANHRASAQLRGNRR